MRGNKEFVVSKQVIDFLHFVMALRSFKNVNIRLYTFIYVYVRLYTFIYVYTLHHHVIYSTETIRDLLLFYYACFADMLQLKMATMVQ